MKTKPAKPSKRRPKARRVLGAGALRTKTFQDGSALILEQNGGIIGLIESRTPY